MNWENNTFIDDYSTVSSIWDKPSIQYHYSWMEAAICKWLPVAKIKTNYVKAGKVLDIGSGAGHWLEFYRRLGYAVDGMEISKSQAEKLDIMNQDIVKDIPYSMIPKLYDIVNAIGVLHHIMTDDKLIKAINNMKRLVHVKPNLIFIGTRFDLELKEKNRWYRPLSFWEKHLDIIGLERSDPGKLHKHLDLIIARA